MAGTKKVNGKKDTHALHVTREKDQDEAEALAIAALSPEFQATLSLQEYTRMFGDVSLDGLVKGLQKQMDATAKGDLGRGEAMLTIQAHTLDAIFNTLARRAINAEYMRNMDTFLKLALRAQSQCRATWEALSAIQNPPVAGYVGQANIAHGPQQVNNRTSPGKTPRRARRTENAHDELLEEHHDERLDTGAPGAAERDDPALAPVGDVDRSEEG